MNRRQKIIVSITGIFIVLLALVGLTYAYFLTQITGNSNPKSISVTTANLELLYKDGNGILNANGVITPDTDITFKNSNNEVVDSKTFSVENKGNGKVNYAVTLEDLKIAYAQDSVIKVNGVDTPVEEGQITEFKYPNDFEITLTCEVIKGTGTCNGGTVLLTNNTNEIMLLNEIEEGAEHSYTLKMKYKDSGENQSEDMNKTFTALVNIIESKDTVDIEGTLTNTTGEELYIQTNSTKRISRVNKDGSYKIVGLEVGKHKLKACKVSDTNCTSPILEKELNIVRGTTAGVSGTTITITEDSRLATININANTQSMDVSGLKDYNPFKEGTLAYTIYSNANNVTSEQEEQGYAVLRNEPSTTPGSSTNSSLEYEFKEEKSSEITIEIPSNLQTEVYDPSTGSNKAHLDDLSSPSYEINSNGKFKLSGSYVSSFAWFKSYQDIYNDLIGTYLCTINVSEELRLNGCMGQEASEIYEITSATSSSLTYRKLTVVDVEKMRGGTDLSVATDDHGASYYFRGIGTNNFVNYSGMCWRIMRILGNGTTKLILADSQNECHKSGYNILSEDSAYIGTTNYSNSNSLDGLKYSSSLIPDKLKSWIKTSNLDTSKLEETEWCNDMSIERESIQEYNGLMDYSYFLYSDNRIKNDNPSLKCDSTGINNSKALKYVSNIGILSADEAIIAGLSKNAVECSNDFSYITQNAKNQSWLMTPILALNNNYYNAVQDYTSEGCNYLNNGVPNSSAKNIRPSIVLKNNVMLKEGEGTKIKPYILQ